MASGTVKWFDDSTGYGFIVPDAGAEDLLVKQSSIQGYESLVKGARVWFDRHDGPRGPEAMNVGYVRVVTPRDGGAGSRSSTGSGAPPDPRSAKLGRLL
jgi:cold shock protein